VALQLLPKPKAKRVDFQIIVRQGDGWVDQADPKIKIDHPNFGGTTKGSSATCPCCGFTTQKVRLREQFVRRHGGADDARLLCVVAAPNGREGRVYRAAVHDDLAAVDCAGLFLEKLEAASGGTLVPDEIIPQERVWKNNPIRVHLYGMHRWRDIFSKRQTLAIAKLGNFVRQLPSQLSSDEYPDLSVAISVCLALAVDRQADFQACALGYLPVNSSVTHSVAKLSQ
jgi:putative DNA methylase